MRRIVTLAAALFAAVPLAAKQPLQTWPLYESVQDPPGQQPRRILVDDNTLAFGQAGDSRQSLAGSDVGFPLYFVRVDGGVRVKGQPMIFPDGSRKHFEFEDYSCSVSGSRTQNVLCRSKSNAQLYHSMIIDGALVSFDLRCFDVAEWVCHYELIGGRPIRPTKVQKS